MKCIEVHSFGSRHLVVIFFHHFHPVGQHAQQCCQQCCQHCCDLRLKTVFRRFNSASGGSLDVQVGCRMGGKWRPTKEWRHIGERWLAAWLACNRIGQTHGFAFSIFSDCMLKFEVIWSHLKSSEVIWDPWNGRASQVFLLGSDTPLTSRTSQKAAPISSRCSVEAVRSVVGCMLHISEDVQEIFDRADGGPGLFAMLAMAPSTHHSSQTSRGKDKMDYNGFVLAMKAVAVPEMPVTICDLNLQLGCWCKKVPGCLPVMCSFEYF